MEDTRSNGTAQLGDRVDTTLNQHQLQQLRLLAQKNGISTSFWGWDGTQRYPSARTLATLLIDMGVPLSGLGEAAQERRSEEVDIWLERALTWTDDQPWLETVPACTVIRVGQSQEVFIHVPDGDPVRVRCTGEGHSAITLEQIDRWVPPRQVGEELRGRATFLVPDTLPVGTYQLEALVGESEESFTGTVYVVPQRNVVSPGNASPSRGDGSSAPRKSRWGVAAQAYSVLSKRSWGIGDAADMADLMAFCAQQGADFLLVNPLHAAEPIVPVENSPYLPVSRRWLNLTYIRPQQIPEYASAPASIRQKVATLEANSWPAGVTSQNRQFILDRDLSWAAKKSALELIFTLPLGICRQAEFDRFQQVHGQSLEDYGLWCALVEHFGTTDLPHEVSSAQDAHQSVLAQQLQPRAQFFKWCQWVASQQLGRLTPVARDLGMQLGLMSDLAVGVHRFGQEYWSAPELFAANTSVGAPPDMYSQQGQNWSQPPWNPRELYRRAYRPFIQLLESVMSIAGAVRIDHILGLFRLWWIPQTAATAGEGAYVNYDHEALVGLLLLQAQKHGVVVVGEDLGTVEPWVRQYLGDRGILGTSVLWFEEDSEGNPLRPADYRANVLATVNTHDLPPTLGYLDGIHTQLRDKLGLLVSDLDEVQAADREQLESVKRRLIEEGCLEQSEATSGWEVLKALHRYIAKSPAQLLAVSLMDIVGQKMPQNLPGTHLEYSNWRVPLTDENGNVVSIDQLVHEDRYRELLQLMNLASS